MPRVPPTFTSFSPLEIFILRELVVADIEALTRAQDLAAREGFKNLVVTFGERLRDLQRLKEKLSRSAS